MKKYYFSYRFIFFIILLTNQWACHTNEKTMTGQSTIQKYSYLALGDSYTIGESVPTKENFPHQVCHLLQNEGIPFENPRIIAKTGWTTDELNAAIEKADANEPIATNYDIVTLLIGVNNQYRGRTVENYAPEFENLLKKAIAFAGGKNKNVIVISIPDWSVTPFAKDRNQTQIAKAIDAYNAMNLKISKTYNITYINITNLTREAATDKSLLTTDGLHPSGKDYLRWAQKIAAAIKKKFQK